MVADVVEGCFRGEDTIGIEAGTHRFQMNERANEKTGGRQQYDRESDLSDDQRLTKAHCAAASDATTRDGGAEIDFSRDEGRKHAEEDAGQQRERQGESEDAPVERNVGHRQKVLR